ncbi:MalY/PatB family protein [Desnuesiella massiliensis]|uniref:MalY/PatB family protein n=1 Tax=Desnuesiella massiliensis TaxID=1650662 RepID=UPI0006E173AB|nr:MalY/PatB family protein [Desnuesiella massiliensis]
MIYDFDKIIDRKNTTCVKWDEALNCSGEELLPMWVADMDLPCPKEVQEAILSRADHAVFGYTYPKEEVYKLIIDRVRENYGWQIKKEWIVFLPGVVDGISSSVQGFSKEGEGVIIQEPVYHPFKNVVKGLKRVSKNNQLKLAGEKYVMDYENLKKLCKEEDTKLAILCSPHNPVGRVWSREELISFGNACIENDVIIVSDEIHSDIIYKGNKHSCFGAISEEFAQNSIVLMAPSKTFNVAGLSQAFAIITNDSLRDTFIASRVGMNWGNVFGITALEACYKYGEDYLKDLLQYLEENVDYVKSFIEERIPNIKMFKPEGTYLLWLDMRALGMKQQELDEFLLNKVKIKFNSGVMFGEAGEGFQRMNIGCPRSYIEEAMHRLEEAIRTL